MGIENHKLPTELTAEIIASSVNGKNIHGKELVETYETLFTKIMECREKELKKI